VTVLDGLGDQGHVTGRTLGREGTVADELGEGLALDVIHREIREPFVVSDFVDGHDVGVLERGGRSGFLLESGAGGGIGEVSPEQDLDGDDTSEAALARAEDDAHAAAGDFLEQVVIPQLSDGWNRRGSGGLRAGGIAKEAARAELRPHPGRKRGAAIRAGQWIHGGHRMMEARQRKGPRCRGFRRRGFQGSLRIPPTKVTWKLEDFSFRFEAGGDA